MSCILYVMVGQAGCGKSTIVKKALEQLPAGSAKVVSRDDIRFSLIGENDYFSKEKEVFNQFCRQIDIAARQSDYVFADATHLTVNSRRKLLSHINRELFDEINAIWVNTPLDVTIQQNAQRTGRRFVPPEVIQKMYFQLEVPTYEEGFHLVYEVVDNQVKTFQF